MTAHTIILLGDTTVGKTSLLNKILYDEFDDYYQSTILNKKYIININLNTQLVFNDVANQMENKFITLINCGLHSIALIMYDVTNKKSFETAEYWLRRLEIVIPTIKKILIANKIDLEDDICIYTSEGIILAAKYDVTYLETSVKENIDIDQVMNNITDVLE